MAATQDNIWQPLRFFEGTWTGKGGGEPGIGNYERSYRFIFGQRFLEVRNKSSYPPSGDALEGEVHEDIGYFSYDKGRNCFVLRQFHTEGFVNQYRLDSISAAGRQIVFVSEAIENIPAGWQAKESYQVIDKDEFMETFELAAPGKEFELYTAVTLHREV